MTCPCCCSEPGACCVPSGSSYVCQQKTSCECSTLAGWFHGAAVACATGLCSAFNPCSFCCSTLPSTISVAISVQFDKLVLSANSSSSSPFGSSVISASGLVGSKSLTGNVTLTGGSGACRNYSFSGCGPYGDMQNLVVGLSQVHADGDCRWRISIRGRYLSAVTYGNDATFDCKTGTTASFFDSGSYEVAATVVTGRTCSLSGIVFSGSETFVRAACTPVSGTNSRSCRIADIDEESGTADISFGSLPEQTITAEWTATIQ